MKNEIHVSIFGEEQIPKLDIIRYYLKKNNISEIKPKKGRICFYVNSSKVKIYEFSDTHDKKNKDLPNNQCVIIIFDMTNRKSFTNVLDVWIKHLREMKYNNQVVLFGIGNKDALIMTDQQEINYLIEITRIKGCFHDLRNKEKDDICSIIDNLIEKIFEIAKNNTHQKDCKIF